MNPLISVIVPVYNVEQYVSDCLDSIISQTYRNLEILVVDDGSTDSSGCICDKYAEIDGRMVVFHKENGGLSDARNYALERCTGEYITFVDSDDLVAQDYVAYLYGLAVKYGADVSTCKYEAFLDKVRQEHEKMTNDGYMASPEKCIAVMSLCTDASHSAWGKMFRRSLWQTSRFPNNLYEDYSIIYYIVSQANICAIGLLQKYYYRQRETSIMGQTFGREKFALLLDIADAVAGWLVRRYPNIDYAIIRMQLTTHCRVMNWIMASDADYAELEKRIITTVNANKKTIIHSKNVQFSDKIKVMILSWNKSIFHAAYSIKEKIECKRNKSKRISESS